MAKMIRNLICGITLHHPLGSSTCNWIVHLDTIILPLIFQYSRKLLPIRRRCPAGCSLAHQLRRLTVWDWAPLSLFLSYMHMFAHPLTLSLSLIHSHANPHSFSLSLSLLNVFEESFDEPTVGGDLSKLLFLETVETWTSGFRMNLIYEEVISYILYSAP